MKPIGYSKLTDLYSPEIYAALNNGIPLYPLTRTNNNWRIKITEISDILRKIQAEIDYEKDRCPCCGVHCD